MQSAGVTSSSGSVVTHRTAACTCHIILLGARVSPGTFAAPPPIREITLGRRSSVRFFCIDCIAHFASKFATHTEGEVFVTDYRIALCRRNGRSTRRKLTKVETARSATGGTGLHESGHQPLLRSKRVVGTAVSSPPDPTRPCCITRSAAAPRRHLGGDRLGDNRHACWASALPWRRKRPALPPALRRSLHRRVGDRAWTFLVVPRPRTDHHASHNLGAFSMA